MEALIQNRIAFLATTKWLIDQNNKSHPNLEGQESIGTHINNIISKVTTVPTIGFFGDFDSGKSSAINHLLGHDILPSGWQPTTSACIILNSTAHRPKTLASRVYVLDKTFDISNRHCPSEIRKHLIIEGDLSVVLQNGSHSKDVHAPSKGQEEKASFILIYINSELLKLCELIDTPGLGKSDRDRLLALLAVPQCDLTVICHPPHGFIDNNHISLIQQATNSSNRLTYMDRTDKLLLLITHAHEGISSPELKMLREIGHLTLSRVLRNRTHDSFFQGFDESNYRKKIIPFHNRIRNRSAIFNKEIEIFLARSQPAASKSLVSSIDHLLNKEQKRLSDRSLPNRLFGGLIKKWLYARYIKNMRAALTAYNFYCFRAKHHTPLYFLKFLAKIGFIKFSGY